MIRQAINKAIISTGSWILLDTGSCDAEYIKNLGRGIFEHKYMTYDTDGAGLLVEITKTSEAELISDY